MRVLVTRAVDDATELIEGLQRLGHTVLHVPLLAREACTADVHRAARPSHDGWVLTSAWAVPALVGLPHPRWVAAVGPRTRAAAEAAGLRVDHMAPDALATSLVAHLGDLSGQTVLHAHADLAPPDTRLALEAAGAQVIDVVAYRNVEPADAAAALDEVWPVDLVLLLSGSAARRLVRHRPTPWPPSVRVVAIGPSTAAVATSLGVVIHQQAQPHTVAGLLAAVQALPT